MASYHDTAILQFQSEFECHAKICPTDASMASSTNMPSPDSICLQERSLQPKKKSNTADEYGPSKEAKLTHGEHFTAKF